MEADKEPVSAAAERFENDELRCKWLTDDIPDAEYWRGVLRAITAWRNEVVEHVASLTGANTTVLELDAKIAERRRELAACNILERDDDILTELKGLRRAAGKQAVMRVIDHPLVRWILEAKIKKIAEIRGLVKASQQSHHKTD